MSEVDKELSYKISYQLRTIADIAYGKRDNSHFPQYSGGELARWLKMPSPSVQEKLNLLLRQLAAISEYPGELIRFDSNFDYSTLCAKNQEEAGFYLDALATQGVISRHRDGISTAAAIKLDRRLGENAGGHYLTITDKGWIELERIRTTSEATSTGFIAMWFDESRAECHEAIVEAIAEAGYLPIRIDQVEHVNRIDDEIIARIRQSKFLVADFTGQRNGVYFEAGFMLGLGRPVIWLCEKDELGKVHFDTRQYNTIDYSDAVDLKKRLRFRIEAIIGRGPKSTS